MRLDKFLCDMNMGTRSQVKAAIRQGLVTVGGVTAKSGEQKIDEAVDEITFRGKKLQYRKYVYYMMNKPKGVVSATVDNTADTVISLLKENCRKDIFPVGRLDKDVTGLLLLTNDGAMAHRLLAPGRHVDKVYHVTLEHPLSKSDICRLEEGVDIGDDIITLPARVTVLDRNEILLTIHEGKFHQVKRMLFAVGNGVVNLKRISFGCLQLSAELKEGEYRELTAAEIAMLSREK